MKKKNKNRTLFCFTPDIARDMKLIELDKEAYNIVCNWYKIIEFNPFYYGIDFSQIIRFYLWDKVGRALRITNNIDFNEAESYIKNRSSSSFYYTPVNSNGKYRKSFFSRKKSIFVPFQSHYTDLLVEKLKLKDFIVFSKTTSKLIQSKEVVKGLNYRCDNREIDEFYNGLMKALRLMNIELIQEDTKLLKVEIEGSFKITALAKKELEYYKPDGVFVHSDNHPPFINYVLVAKALNIPSFTYQHGLDCEHYFLDDCFADYVGLWSKNRRIKYETSSKIQPKKYKVIGNYFLPETFKIRKREKSICKKLIFITRPHKPVKCYSPSRNYLEGVSILKSILEYLVSSKSIKLVIKPHPMDDCVLYKNLITEFDLDDRVAIVTHKVAHIIHDIDLVITEDSTAGVEALMYGLPVVHAHFASSEPVLPFLNYGAAFSGNDPEELKDSINKGLNLSLKEKQLMNIGQKKMMADFIPNGEVKELVQFISENVL
ncbi:hypothetical protein OAM38_00070 [Flavobacteriaceae bacterium]|nr:hypothetical protein [Flavobacteriaceae bacterium]